MRNARKTDASDFPSKSKWTSNYIQNSSFNEIHFVCNVRTIYLNNWHLFVIHVNCGFHNPFYTTLKYISNVQLLFIASFRESIFWNSLCSRSIRVTILLQLQSILLFKAMNPSYSCIFIVRLHQGETTRLHGHVRLSWTQCA